MEKAYLNKMEKRSLVRVNNVIITYPIDRNIFITRRERREILIFHLSPLIPVSPLSLPSWKRNKLYHLSLRGKGM